MVSTFKYVRVWLTVTLSWSYYIDKTTRKAIRQAGLIYKCFYSAFILSSLLQLYPSYVRPLLEYTVPVWDPHFMLQSQVLEMIERISLRIFNKNCHENYESLLS